MEEEQPPPINFRQPIRSSGMRSTGQNIAIGTLVGSAASGIAWIIIWHLADDRGLMVFLSLLAFKAILGIVTSFYENWKGFVVGLVISLGVGALIFFGTCFVAISKA
jgi:hypothetical protein